MRIEEEFLPPCAWCGYYTDLDDASPMCQLHRACYILVGAETKQLHANEISWVKRNAFPRGVQTLDSQRIVEEFEETSSNFRRVMSRRTPPHL